MSKLSFLSSLVKFWKLAKAVVAATCEFALFFLVLKDGKSWLFIHFVNDCWLPLLVRFFIVDSCKFMFRFLAHDRYRCWNKRVIFLIFFNVCYIIRGPVGQINLMVMLIAIIAFSFSCIFAIRNLHKKFCCLKK